MRLPFINRAAELAELESAAKRGGLLVVFGRRRIGKTRLLTEWLGKGGMYSQAIEAATPMQIEQVMRDLGPALETSIEPRSWAEFLDLISLWRKDSGGVLCLDEFPYLVASDPSLPSVLQRWLDHRMPRGFTLVLSGSSTGAMNACFLNRQAPLYQRADKLLLVRPMDYAAFCVACGCDPAEPESFVRHAMVGGVPKYWEFVERDQPALQLAEILYFGASAYLEDEPLRLLRDESMPGLNALSVLEAVGRGAWKPSEIAARMGTVQTNLGRTFQQLLDAALLTREIPFGESLRTTKRSGFRMADPALRFWFNVYSPHRTRWRLYTPAERKKLLHDHAATVFEDYCRERFADAARYWEGDVELDFVRRDGAELVVSEVKFKRLGEAGKLRIMAGLRSKFSRSKLAATAGTVRFEVWDQSALGMDG